MLRILVYCLYLEIDYTALCHFFYLESQSSFLISLFIKLSIFSYMCSFIFNLVHSVSLPFISSSLFVKNVLYSLIFLVYYLLNSWKISLVSATFFECINFFKSAIFCLRRCLLSQMYTPLSTTSSFPLIFRLTSIAL